MNISSINNLNINQNNSRKNLKANPNFTSIIPTKVFKDGELVTKTKDIRRAIRVFFKDLMSYSVRNENGRKMRAEIIKYDKEINFNLNDNGKVIRDYVSGFTEGVFHFFTGGYAQELDELGRQIGPVKAGYSDKNLEDLNKAYFDKAKTFLSSKHDGARLGEKYDCYTRTYSGDKLGLHILIKEIPTKRGSKFIVDGIKFRTIGKKNTPKPTPAAPNVNPPPTTVNNTAATVKYTSKDAQMTDFPQGVKRSKPEGSQIYLDF